MTAVGNGNSEPHLKIPPERAAQNLERESLDPSVGTGVQRIIFRRSIRSRSMDVRNLTKSS
jgi:hypothetical protein